MNNETIKSYLDSGLSVVPVNGDNGRTPSKAPAISNWKPLMSAKMNDSDIESSFSVAGGVGIIGGSVSGNLVIIDFDNHDGKAKERFKKILDLIGEIISSYNLPYETTPSGGYHLYFRSLSKTDGNRKLATVTLHARKDTIIETRGEGGYAVCAPTKGYNLIFGNLCEINPVSKEDEEYIYSICKSFNEIDEKSITNSIAKGVEVSSERPGDEYNSSSRALSEIPQILEHAGWKKRGSYYWIRPGKNARNGISATFGKAKTESGIPLFHVFSSNAYPFEEGKNYTPFAVFSIIAHNGNFSDSAKELVEEGFGNHNSGKQNLPKDIADNIKSQEERLKTVNTAVAEKEDNKKKGRKCNIAEVKDFLSNTWEFRLNVINNNVQSRKRGELEWSDVNENDVWMDVNENCTKMAKDNVKSILGSSFVEEYNPFVDFFTHLPEYDGVDYFADMCQYIKTDNNDFFRDMMEKDFVRAIKCALEDDYYNRMVIVLQSEKQEIGKSRFIHWLSPFGNEYYSEQPLSDNKDCQIALSETFIYNLEELDDMKQKGLSSIKSNLAKYAVLERRPYASQATLMPRRCTFFASTNYTEFLTDNVNTRWLIFHVSEINDSLWEKVNPFDLWTQAWALYNDKSYEYELTPEEKKMREDRNKSFRETPIETELIIKFFEKSDDSWMMIPDIIRELIGKAGYGIRINTSPTNISQQLDALGFEKKEENVLNIRIKLYKIKLRQ